jgi:hypothetical protein
MGTGERLTGLGDIWQEWRALGLPEPPLPFALAAPLNRLDASTYTTRATLPYSLYALDAYVEEAERGVAPYLATGQAGHGVNSWAMHYYFVDERLQIFVQSRYGGAYGNADRETAAVVARFGQVRRLLDAADAARHDAFDSLRVVESDLRGSHWILGGAARADTSNALKDATSWLDRNR